MAKKTKEATAAKKPKVVAPIDPVKTRNLLRLVSILALLLAIAAFLLQLFAVLTHHWKWQSTHLRPLVSTGYHHAQPIVHEDSRIQQDYGLLSRKVKVYANNDEQINVLASTRFPRIDDGAENFQYCLYQTSTLRSAFLTCSNQVNSVEQCHCRRYPYWKWVIFFEITALILLGLVVFLAALQSTHLGNLLRLAALGLAFLAFIFLLLGLILILAYLRRETRSFADAYPYINRRVIEQIAIPQNQNRVQRAVYNTPLQHIRKRRATEFYRAYPLLPGQHPYNDTHYQEYSERLRTWVYRPYTSLNPNQLVVARESIYSASAGARHRVSTAAPQRVAAAAPLSNQYSSVIGYGQVIEATKAGIGCSTVLSILALILSLLAALLLAFAWLTGKKLAPPAPPSGKKDYVAVPLNPHDDPVATTETTTTKTIVRTIPQDYDPHRPIGDAIVTTRNVPPGQFSEPVNPAVPVVYRDVVITDPVVSVTAQQRETTPVAVESKTTTTIINP